MTPPIPADDVDAILASLTLRDKIAQLMMPWIAGGYAPFDDPALARAAAWVDSLHVGGVIVSVGSPHDVAAKLNHLQARSPLPLLVGSDFEAGTAIRLSGGTAFPTNMGVGAGGRELDAYEMGRVTALEGRAVGVHLAFAPVADVNNNPANPIVNTRSFGEDPAAVARLVAAQVRGIEEHGMLATVKHFPGHGDTGTDSHLALPVIGAPWGRFDSLELVPFRAAIGAGVSAVMSAHIAVPGIDSGPPRPGTVAPTIMTGVLRDSLGFGGLAVTDALNMAGVIDLYGHGETAVLALVAGADLLLQPVEPSVAIDAVEAAVRQGRIAEERLDRSVRKVLALKRRLGLFAARLVPVDSVGAVVGRAEFQRLARDVAQRAVVLAADSAGVVDSLRARRRRVALVTYGDEASPAAGTTLATELRALGDTVTVFRLTPLSTTASYDSARAALERQPVALFAAAVRASAWRGTIALPESLARLIDSTAATRPTVVISLGSPYIISQTPRVGSFLLAWAANAAAEAAAAHALAGGPITGTLPIRIPPRFPMGAGLRREATDSLR